MSPLRLNGSTSGYAELAASATAGDVILTLPSTAGTLDRTNRVGNILQVVSANYSTQVSTTSSSYTDTGLSASITPSSASNKILVLVSHGTVVKDSVNAGSRLFIQLVRGSTAVTELGNSLLFTNSNLEIRSSAHFTYLDSPATTSPITYKTQFYNGAGAGTVFVQFNGSLSTMTLLEVAA